MAKRWTEEDLARLRPGMVNISDSGQKVSNKEENIPESPEKYSAKAAKNIPQALGRLPTGKMNKTEARYAAHLELQKAAGEVLWWAFEPMNLRLGTNCFYRVDFLVLKADGSLEAHEVKGYWTDDALVKIRVAAEKFPFAFIAVRWVNDQWEYRHF